MLDARALGQLENVRRLSRAGRGREALALCEPLVSAYPKEPEVWFERGQCDFNLGRFENARRAWTIRSVSCSTRARAAGTSR